MVELKKIIGYVQLSLKNLKNRKLRSWLTMIGIFIGVAAVIALSSLGLGLNNYVNEQFEILGANKIFVIPGGSMFGMGGLNTLEKHDIKLLKKIRGVKEITGYLMETGMIEWEDETTWNYIIGIPEDQEEQSLIIGSNYKIKEGRTIKKGDKNKAIIGYNYAYSNKFKKKLRIGNKILINGKKFDVIGVFERVGNDGDDTTIAIPLTTARELFGEKERVDTIIIEAEKAEELSAVAESIEKTMRKDRNQKEGDEDFEVQTSEDLLKSMQNIIGIIIGTVILIAAISLLVGAVGIMNTMYTAVLERTKEIGVMKAIGAKNSDVMSIFLIESGFLGLAGGTIGIIMGVIIAKITTYSARTFAGLNLDASFPPQLIIGILLFSLITGLISGLMPARQAASKNPVDSLRYE